MIFFIDILKLLNNIFNAFKTLIFIKIPPFRKYNKIPNLKKYYIYVEIIKVVLNFVKISVI